MRGSSVPDGLFLVSRRASVGGLGATEASRTAVGAAHAAAAAAHAYVCMLLFGDWAGSAGVASIVCVCGRCLGAVVRGVLTMSPGVAGSLRQQRALPSAASRAVGSEWVFVLKKVASSSACMLVCSIPDSAAAGSSTAEAGSISPSPQSAFKSFCCDVLAGSVQFWWLPRFPLDSVSDFSVCAIALDLS